MTYFTRNTSLLLLLTFISTASAQVVTTVVSESPLITVSQDEDDPDQQANYFNVLERNKVTTDVEFLDTDLMGDTVDPYSGSLSLRVTDIALPGNSTIPVQLSRAISSSGQFGGPLADWTLDIPRLEGRYGIRGRNDFVDGPDCTKDIPGPIDVRGTTFKTRDYHHGLHLHDGNGGSELVITPSTSQPYALPSGYTRQTKNHWVLKCSGSDYIARSPDGLTYTFSVEARRFSAPATQGLGIILITQTVAKMVSRIEDRFGHSVDFSYTAIDLPYGAGTYPSHRLSTITASDGRLITLSYEDGDSGKLTSAIAAGETWSYDYNASGGLSTVNLPDGRQWQYSLNGFKGFLLDGDEAFETEYPTLAVSVTHPYGTTATYALKSQWQYKPGYINPHILAGNTTPKEKQSRNRVLAVASKTLTIPGNETLTWSYAYSDSGHAVDLYDYPNKSWLTRSTIDKQVNTITGPYNKVTNTFSRWKDWLEGSLLNQKTYELTGSTALNELATTYAKTGTFQGAAIGFDGSNQDLNRTARGPATEITTQNGNTYTKTTSGYNLYGAPTDSSATNNFNSLIKYSKRTYQHDTANGVLNLPAKTYITATALTDTANVTPTRETTYRSVSLNSRSILMPDYQKAFGHWQQYFSDYHTDGNQIGQLKTVQYQQTLSSDGNSYQTFTDYHRGQPKTITLPNRYDTGTMSLSRLIDDNGRVTQLTDLNGNITKYGYDAVGRLQSVNPSDATWADTLYAWSTNTSSQPVRTVSRCTLNALNTACDDTAAILTATTTFDGLLRPTQLATTDVANNITVYQNSKYNAFNQLTFQSFPSAAATESNGTSYTYDALTRVKTQITTGAGTTTTDYLADNKIKVTDGEGNLTTTTYQAFGEPTYQHATDIDSPENVDTSITVNLFGRITEITQSGFNGSTAISQTEYRAYDSQQRLCQIERNDVGTTVMSLNAAGNIVWQAQGQTATSHTACNTTATNKVNFTYDNHGAQRSITATGAPSVTYTLDNNGDMTTLTSGTVSQTYTYNSARLLNKETLALDGKSLSLNYGYSNQGHLSSLTYPNNTVVSFAPNAFGQATKATKPTVNYATSASYHPNGMINTFTYGNGVVHKTTLNTQQLPSEIRDHKDQTNRVKLGYTYDNENNVKSITDGVDANFSLTALSYDGLGRLTSTTGGNGIGDSSISYDGLGNIRSYSTLNSHKNHNLSYQYDATHFRLTGVTGTGAAGYNFSGTGSYDARGNVTNNGMRDFTYNLRNQLTASSGNSYLYDGHNRRVKTTDSHGISYSLYNQAGKLLYRETADGGVNYIFLGSKLIAKEGMMPVKTDSTSNSRMHYKPFGDSIETAKDEVGYTGHKFDTDLGLSYMQARYMDPALGRFMSNDPVGYIAANPVMSFNRYLYVNNNPYKYVDPDGELLANALGGIAGMVSVASYQYLTTGELDLIGVAWGGLMGAATGGRSVLNTVGQIAKLESVIMNVSIGLISGTGAAIIDGKFCHQNCQNQTTETEEESEDTLSEEEEESLREILRIQAREREARCGRTARGQNDCS